MSKDHDPSLERLCCCHSPPRPPLRCLCRSQTLKLGCSVWLKRVQGSVHESICSAELWVCEVCLEMAERVCCCGGVSVMEGCWGEIKCLHFVPQLFLNWHEKRRDGVRKCLNQCESLSLGWTPHLHQDDSRPSGRPALKADGSGGCCGSCPVVLV